MKLTERYQDLGEGTRARLTNTGDGVRLKLAGQEVVLFWPELTTLYEAAREHLPPPQDSLYEAARELLPTPETSLTEEWQPLGDDLKIRDFYGLELRYVGDNDDDALILDEQQTEELRGILNGLSDRTPEPAPAYDEDSDEYAPDGLTDEYLIGLLQARGYTGTLTAPGEKVEL